MTAKQAFRFPCEFPIKIMGLNSPAFPAAVDEIIARHLKTGTFTVTRRTSSSAKYLSLTVTFTAESREQLDALYTELNASDLVVMTL